MIFFFNIVLFKVKILQCLKKNHVYVITQSPKSINLHFCHNDPLCLRANKKTGDKMCSKCNHFHSSHSRYRAESWFLPQCYSSVPISFQRYHSYWTPSSPQATSKERERKMTRGTASISDYSSTWQASWKSVSDSLIWIYHRGVASNYKKDNVITQMTVKNNMIETQKHLQA